MAKLRPYIIHDHLTVQEIIDLINDAYDEGRDDGYRDGYEDCENDIRLEVYDEGYEDGYKKGFEKGKEQAKDEWLKSITITDPNIVTTPLINPNLITPTTPVTPNDWPPDKVIYCGNNTQDKTSTGDTV